MNGSRRSNKKNEDNGNQDRWLVTYADLITLLMIFFVLMYTMSQVDAKKYAAVVNSLSVVLTGESLSLLETQGPSVVDGVSGQQVSEGTIAANQGQLQEVKELIQEFIATQEVTSPAGGAGGRTTKLGEHILVYEQERGLVISFKDTLLFGSGSDELTPQARNIIRQVGEALDELPNYIRVEGHTDDLPIHTSRFPSNWELSVLRASNVVHVLQEDGGVPAEKLSITGYGEYRPLVANEGAMDRAMNRRVDIVILKQKYDYFEPPTVD